MHSSVLILLALAFGLFAPLGTVQAQSAPAVQEVHGSLAPGQQDVYRLQGLRQGQVLDAFAENRSGNVDPILFILPDSDDVAATLASYRKDLADLMAGSDYPMVDLPALIGAAAWARRIGYRHRRRQLPFGPTP